MQEIRCYRLPPPSGASLRLEPDPAAELLTLRCCDDVRVGRSGTGAVLLYRDGPYGVPPEQAIQLGWGCLVDPNRPPNCGESDNEANTEVEAGAPAS